MSGRRIFGLFSICLGLLFLYFGYNTLGTYFHSDWKVRMAYGLKPSDIARSQILKVVFPMHFAEGDFARMEQNIDNTPTTPVPTPAPLTREECMKKFGLLVAKAKKDNLFLGTYPSAILPMIANKVATKDNQENGDLPPIWPRDSSSVRSSGYLASVRKEIGECGKYFELSPGGYHQYAPAPTRSGWSVMTIPFMSGFITGEVNLSRSSQRFWFFDESAAWVRPAGADKFELAFEFKPKPMLPNGFSTESEKTIFNWKTIALSSGLPTVGKGGVDSAMYDEAIFNLLNLDMQYAPARAALIDLKLSSCKTQDCFLVLTEVLKANLDELKKSPKYLTANATTENRDLLYKMFELAVFVSKQLQKIQLKNEFECYDTREDRESCGLYAYVLSLVRENVEIPLAKVGNEECSITLTDAAIDVYVTLNGCVPVNHFPGDLSPLDGIYFLNFKYKKANRVFASKTARQLIATNTSNQYPLHFFEYLKKNDKTFLSVHTLQGRGMKFENRCFSVEPPPNLPLDRYWKLEQKSASQYVLQDTLTDQGVTPIPASKKLCEQK